MNSPPSRAYCKTYLSVSGLIVQSIDRRSRLTTLIPNNNLWDVKEPLALFEKSRARSSRCHGLSD